jgi:transcriptional activator of cad operon
MVLLALTPILGPERNRAIAEPTMNAMRPLEANPAPTLPLLTAGLKAMRRVALRLHSQRSRRSPPALRVVGFEPQSVPREARMPTGKPGEVVQVGDWFVNPTLDCLYRGSESHKLEPRMMRLLVCLANSVGAVVSVDRLLTEVWTGVIVGPASVYQAVSQLRKLLGDVDPDPTYIATVPRKGYRLIATVHRATAAARSTTAAISPLPAPAVRARRWMPKILGGVALLALMLVGGSIWTQLPDPQVGESSASIVVLPFVNLTPDKANQAFCDGLTEELSHRLSQIATLRVVARTSAFAFLGLGEDVRAIGRELDTNHILEGSVRRSGNKMRVTVRLVDARNGYRLWSTNYDMATDDLLRVQEDISQSVAENLQARLAKSKNVGSGAQHSLD